VNPKINVIHYISKILYHDEHFSALHVGVVVNIEVV